MPYRRLFLSARRRETGLYYGDLLGAREQEFHLKEVPSAQKVHPVQAGAALIAYATR